MDDEARSVKRGARGLFCADRLVVSSALVGFDVVVVVVVVGDDDDGDGTLDGVDCE